MILRYLVPHMDQLKLCDAGNLQIRRVGDRAEGGGVCMDALATGCRRSTSLIPLVPLLDLAAAVDDEGHFLAVFPRASTKLVSNLDGGPGQQEHGAKRDQRKSRPIRFDPKAASRSFRFQFVNRRSMQPQTRYRNRL
jgi:hypothetical protein